MEINLVILLLVLGYVGCMRIATMGDSWGNVNPSRQGAGNNIISAFRDVFNACDDYDMVDLADSGQVASILNNVTLIEEKLDSAGNITDVILFIGGNDISYLLLTMFTDGRFPVVATTQEIQTIVDNVGGVIDAVMNYGSSDINVHFPWYNYGPVAPTVVNGESCGHGPIVDPIVDSTYESVYDNILANYVNNNKFFHGGWISELNREGQYYYDCGHPNYNGWVKLLNYPAVYDYWHDEVNGRCFTSRVCDSGWSRYSSQCYKQTTATMKSPDAESGCDGLRTGAVPAVISDNDLDSWILNNVGTGWINYYDDCNGWKWVNGESYTYTSWRDGQPNNNCPRQAYLLNTGWFDLGSSSSGEKYALCEYPATLS